jgi:hypothetical protein
MRSSGRGAIILLGGLGVASVAVLAVVSPITQNPSYHAFADARPLLGIPYFWNVVSNLPFVAIGVAGLAFYRKDAAATALFIGFLLTGIGSSYYHVAPDDGTLFWDRLPMTIGFMALLAGALGERFGEAFGTRALWPLLATGAASPVWWRWTGDLRPYVWVQFYPCIALPILYLCFPATTGTAILVTAAVLYGLSKVLEYSDGAIYAASGSIVSRHTLKHLVAAAACYALLRYIAQRRPLAQSDPRKAADAA